MKSSYTRVAILYRAIENARRAACDAADPQVGSPGGAHPRTPTAECRLPEIALPEHSSASPHQRKCEAGLALRPIARRHHESKLARHSRQSMAPVDNSLKLIDWQARSPR